MITCGVTPAQGAGWPSEGGCGFKGAESEFDIAADENGDESAQCGKCFHITPLEDAAFREGGEFYEGDKSIYS